MNKIILNKKLENIEYNIGSLFKDSDSEEVFILSRISICPNEYVAVSLSDGSTLNGICKSVNDAVHGLTYIGINAKITID